LSAGWAAPAWFGSEPGSNRLIFAIFFATALSISALPVIAKTLMDMNILQSDLGILVIAAAVVNDLLGWLIFALILALLGPESGHWTTIGFTIAATLVFVIFVLTIGRWSIHRALPVVQAHSGWPGGVLGFALSLGLLGAAITEWIGVHAVFGAFLVGVAIGDSSHLREQTRSIITQFVSFIFAPLFFASIGLGVNFADHFDAGLTAAIIALACAGKVLGCGWGARLGGVARRESWAIGFAMNARGAMEIILGTLALQAGVIRERMFVSLVVMALFTSLICGSAIRRILRLRKPRGVRSYISNRTFVAELRAGERDTAILELSEKAAVVIGAEPSAIAAAVLEREAQGPTGLGSRIAVPHARWQRLNAPVVALGLSPRGVDFNAPDGEPAQLIFLILTPRDDDGAQIEILADIARTFLTAAHREKALQVKSYTEFLALLTTHGSTA